ncbi:MAG: LPS-assembly protein LptD [Bryobacteraceae bacterium]
MSASLLRERREEAQLRRTHQSVSNIFGRICHDFFRGALAAPLLAAVLAAAWAAGQGPIPGYEKAAVIERRDVPPEGIVVVRAAQQEREESRYRLRGKAQIETREMLLEAEEIDYDQETGVAEARGRAHYVNFTSGEQLWAERIDYNLKDASGAFYRVRGAAYGKIDYRPGILRTENPFFFQGDWAEKIQQRYILHKARITNCTGINPWWRLEAPVIDVIPGRRAIAHRSWFKLRGVPILFAPAFYKDLREGARKSGFLTPSVGNSNRRGLMYGLGYFWAINRSYDVSYRPQYFTLRGLAHTVDFRAKPTQRSELSVFVYGIRDRGRRLDGGGRVKEGGYLVTAQGRAELGRGFYARGMVNYLSNFAFRQAFTESLNEAVFSEVNSVVNISRDWSTYSFNAVFTRQENFQSTQPGDTILLRKLPQLEWESRDREVVKGALPVWLSWSASGGLLQRNQPLFQTRQFVERFDLQPRLMTALRWKEFHLLPYVLLRGTHYGSSFRTAWEKELGKEVTGEGMNRVTRELGADLVLPPLVRVFEAPRWMGGKVKHAIEPRAGFRTVAGASRFEQLVRFDELELVSDTTEIEYSLTQRLWVKGRDNRVRDLLAWEVRQKRYFDPDFGGAVVAGRRNVVASSAELSAFAFLDGPRRTSPVVNVLRAQPAGALGVEWRGDYDPVRGRLTNSSVTVDTRSAGYFLSLGHTRVSCVPLSDVEALEREAFCRSAPSGQVLSPPSNQFRGTLGLGNENRRGWNAGVYGVYDYSIGVLQYINTQITYNTECCAFSGQYRRFNFGARSGENQFRLALVIANIGSFGTLKRQERLF